MVRGHTIHQRNRDEQLQLRNQLANVYNVVRDLGLHYEMKEISGCSFITIGRTEHNYSHLDKNLTLTAPTTRAGENIQNDEQNSDNMGDDKVSSSDQDQTIQTLHKAYMEKEKETIRLNCQLENLSSQLQTVNNEGRTLQNLHKTSREQEKEIKRLTSQLSNLSLSVQATDCLAKEEAAIKMNLERTVSEQSGEIHRLTNQLSDLSSLLKVEAEKKDEKKDVSDNNVLKQEDLKKRLDQLSSQLESCNVAKIRAEELAAQYKESAENYKKDIKTLEINKLFDEKGFKVQIKTERDAHTKKKKMYESLAIKWSMSENTISELTKSLETAENKLSSIKEEASDKDDKIKVISDQNKTLTMEKSKILAKLKQQQEDHELQLATQQNLAFKMEAASKTLVKRLDETIYGQKGEIKCLTSQISKLSPKRQGNAEKKKKKFFCSLRPGEPAVWVYQQLPNNNLSEPKDCIEAAEVLKNDEITTESLTQTEIIMNWLDAFSNKAATIVTAEMKFFEDARTDHFRHSRDHKDYFKAVAKLIMSVDGINTIANLATEIGSSVENVDKLLISPNYTELASCLGWKIKEYLPTLMLILEHDSFPHDDIATCERFHAFKEIIREDLEDTLLKFLGALKCEAFEAVERWGDVSDEITDTDKSESESGPESDSSPTPGLDAPLQPPSMTSTPHKHQSAKKEENLNENATDSGIGTSGFLDTSAHPGTSEGELLKIFSSLSNLYGETSLQEPEKQNDTEDRSDEWHFPSDQEI